MFLMFTTTLLVDITNQPNQPNPKPTNQQSKSIQIYSNLSSFADTKAFVVQLDMQVIPSDPPMSIRVWQAFGHADHLSDLGR